MHKSVGYVSHATLLLDFQCYHLQEISNFGCTCVVLMPPVCMDAVSAAFGMYILYFSLSLCLPCTGQTNEDLLEWATAEAQLSSTAFHNFRMDWNRKFVQKVCADVMILSVSTPAQIRLDNQLWTVQVKSIPGVSGAHLMPVTNTGRKMALDLIDEGSM